MVMIMGALSETLAVLGVVSESLAFLGSRLGALGRQAHVAGLARLARPLVVVVVTAPRAQIASRITGIIGLCQESNRISVG